VDIKFADNNRARGATIRDTNSAQIPGFAVEKPVVGSLQS
jgi:hypothetical protein